jgi:hypothetical protein
MVFMQIMSHMIQQLIDSTNVSPSALFFVLVRHYNRIIDLIPCGETCCVIVSSGRRSPRENGMARINEEGKEPQGIHRDCIGTSVRKACGDETAWSFSIRSNGSRVVQFHKVFQLTPRSASELK